jgi:hypothetical protein
MTSNVTKRKKLMSDELKENSCDVSLAHVGTASVSTKTSARGMVRAARHQ